MMETKKERSYGEITKSAFVGLAQFGLETSRLVGKSAKAAWFGARKVGGRARVKASEKANELKEKRAANGS
jgi:hypothetical protein